MIHSAWIDNEGQVHVRESAPDELPDMDWGQHERMFQEIVEEDDAMIAKIKACRGARKPVPWYVGALGAAMFGGAALWGLIEIYFMVRP